MRISIFGLGYVGCINMASFAKIVNHVIGYDIDQNKINLINKGQATIIEKDADKYIKEAFKNNLIESTNDYKYAILNSDISFISVDTPTTKSGNLNLKNIYDIASKIGSVLKEKNSFHIIAIRSTVLPGTNNEVGKIISKLSGKVRNKDFAVVSNPEFLREGSAFEDFFNPPFTIVGTDNDNAKIIFEKLYKGVKGEFIYTDIKVAEIMKYINNTYHALKVVFANEVGNICKGLNINSHEVMDIFCKDKILNISPYYFKPGFAYGGSCLPKDTKALKTLAKDLSIETPIINSIELSNNIQINNAINIIKNKNEKNIGILGLSFKSGTDDLRNSSIINVIESLIADGCIISIYDEKVFLSIKNNINSVYIKNNFEYLCNLVTNNLDDVINKSNILVIANKEKEFIDIPNKYPNKIIIDLVGQFNNINYDGIYEGISWSNAAKDEKE